MAPKNKDKLADHYHYIDFLQKKVKWSYDAFINSFPSFAQKVRHGHERRAMEIAQNAVKGLSPGVTISMTSTSHVDKMRPIPDDVCILSLDSLIIDLKRMIMFSLSTVELAQEGKHDSNRSFEKFLDQCAPEFDETKSQRSKLTQLIVADPRADDLKKFLQENLASLRKLNGQRASLEHIDLYYGVVHHLSLKWPEVDKETTAPPSVDSAQFIRAGKDFVQHVSEQTQLAIDLRNLCGSLAKQFEVDRISVEASKP